VNFGVKCCDESTSQPNKMHQIVWRPGLRPGPHWGSLQRSPDPLAGFKGGRRERGGEGRAREGREGQGRGREGREAEERERRERSPK
jgi:hypothetical protein